MPIKDFIPRSKDDVEDQSSCDSLLCERASRLTCPDNDPEKWWNAPIGLQLTARRLEEEKVVSMLVVIKEALDES